MSREEEQMQVITVSRAPAASESRQPKAPPRPRRPIARHQRRHRRSRNPHASARTDMLWIAFGVAALFIASMIS